MGCRLLPFVACVASLYPPSYLDHYHQQIGPQFKWVFFVRAITRECAYTHTHAHTNAAPNSPPPLPLLLPDTPSASFFSGLASFLPGLHSSCGAPPPSPEARFSSPPPRPYPQLTVADRRQAFEGTNRTGRRHRRNREEEKVH